MECSGGGRIMAIKMTEIKNEMQKSREYYNALNKLYIKIRDTGDRWLGDTFYEIVENSFNPFLPCSKDVWVERHPEGLPARLYLNTKDLKSYPSIDELEKVKKFWDSLTDEERESVDEMYKEIRTFTKK